MRSVTSCGVFVLREAPSRSFLLLKHARRYDLPKGHKDEGESEIDCALRELFEETGIERHEIELDPDFRHEERYLAAYARFKGKEVSKTLVIFLGRLLKPKEIVLSEHVAYEWVDWAPPHRIQARVVDGLLMRVEHHLRRADRGR